MTMRLSLLTAATAAVQLFPLATGVIAQTGSPPEDIRILYGYPSVSDLVPRALAEKLGESLKTTVKFENVPAGGGIIAADRAANAQPDGGTLYMAGAPTIAIHPALDDSLSYSPVRDFAPVTQLFTFAHLMVVQKDIPATTVQEFLALAKAQPGKLRYGHFGIGGPSHLATERLKSRTGVDIQPVSYRDPGALVLDLMAGRISMCLCRMGTGMQLVSQRLARPLAVTSANRSPFAPRVPTMIEAGVPGFEFTSWMGLFAPAGTPAHLIERLHQHVVRVLARPQVRATLADAMMEPVGNTPAQFAIVIDQEINTWANTVKETGIRLHN